MMQDQRHFETFMQGPLEKFNINKKKKIKIKKKKYFVKIINAFGNLAKKNNHRCQKNG